MSNSVGYNLVLIIHIAAFTLTSTGLAINLLTRQKTCKISEIFGIYRCSFSAFLLFVTGVWLSRKYIQYGHIPTWIILKFTIWVILFVLSAYSSAKLETRRELAFYLLFGLVIFEIGIAIFKPFAA